MSGIELWVLIPRPIRTSQGTAHWLCTRGSGSCTGDRMGECSKVSKTQVMIAYQGQVS